MKNGIILNASVKTEAQTNETTSLKLHSFLSGGQ